MMSVDGMLEELGLIEWDGPFDAATRGRAVTALEEGRVLFLPRLAFRLDAAEQRFLTPDVAGGDRKNVSFDPISGKLGGSALAGEDAAALGAMIDRFGRQAATLLGGLVPRYAPYLERARTSYRPVEVKGRAQSVRHDDRLLHVDAFPTRPMGGGGFCGCFPISRRMDRCGNGGWGSRLPITPRVFCRK